MNKMEILTPPGIRKQCLHDKNLVRRYGRIMSCYDPESTVGGIYNLDDGSWILFYPISPEAFANRVVNASLADESSACEKNFSNESFYH